MLDYFEEYNYVEVTANRLILIAHQIELGEANSLVQNRRYEAIGYVAHDTFIVEKCCAEYGHLSSANFKNPSRPGNIQCAKYLQRTPVPFFVAPVILIGFKKARTNDVDS